MSEKSYEIGYHDALCELDHYITRKIKENGGAKDMLQILNVWNQTISYLHIKKTQTQQRIEELNNEPKHGEVEQELTREEEIAQFLEQILKDVFPFPIQVEKAGTMKEEF